MDRERYHHNWTLGESVLFSGESRMIVTRNTRSAFDLTSDNLKNEQVMEAIPASGVQAWTPFVFVSAKRHDRQMEGLKAVKYIEDILAEHVVPYVGFTVDNFTFMHNNAAVTCYKSCAVIMVAVGFWVMKGPAGSPDLNTIGRPFVGESEAKRWKQISCPCVHLKSLLWR